VDGTLPDGYVTSALPNTGATGWSVDDATLIVWYNQPMSYTGARISGEVDKPGQYDLYMEAAPTKQVDFLTQVYDPATYRVTLTFNPSNTNWKASTWYVLKVKRTIENACGVGQGDDVLIRFQTAP
jgi:hypothetical protein